MNRHYFSMITLFIAMVAVVLAASSALADDLADGDESLLSELCRPVSSNLEELLQQDRLLESVAGFASYYARKFEGRRTTSGQRYNPEKMTAAHQSLPLGTVVRVLNPATRQEVKVTINDRCASRSFHFIDLSRAAAKKIGLWGKGKIRVVILI